MGIDDIVQELKYEEDDLEERLEDFRDACARASTMEFVLNSLLEIVKAMKTAA
jgi:hypothetical protein